MIARCSGSKNGASVNKLASFSICCLLVERGMTDMPLMQNTPLESSIALVIQIEEVMIDMYLPLKSPT